MPDIRASEIEEKMRIREYGDLDDDGVIVDSVDQHGDSVLIRTKDGGELTFDRDEVLEVLPHRLIIVDGKPVSSCCQAEIQRTCEYTDTHVFIVDDAEVDETGKVVYATYTFLKTYDGLDAGNITIACHQCGREIEAEDSDEWELNV